VFTWRFIFGLVYSRRLSRSLVVNNVPYKTCTYSCIYCQLGRTTNYAIARKCFYDSVSIVKEIAEFLENFRENIDYITLVPDGEPTLDACIGRIIESIKREYSVKVAVLTNASLLWHSDVREDLAEADYVSVKVDTVNEETWKKLNRPHLLLGLREILEGIVEFSKSYKGIVVSETMLVYGVNTNLKHYEDVAEYLKRFNSTQGIYICTNKTTSRTLR